MTEFNNKCNDKQWSFQRKLTLGLFLVFAAVVILVLYYPPMPGVADQGDFQRVMSVTGLEEIQNDSTASDSHWFKYVTTEYKMFPLSISRFTGIIPTTSMIYPITLARVICILTGSEYFNTRVLAAVYAAIYIISILMCLSWLGLKKRPTFVFISILSLFILMDGNYLVWFNSLYGEPMMITGLLLFCASVLYITSHMENNNFKKEIIFVLIAAFLFLGSKMQVFSALPFIILFFIHIFLPKKGYGGLPKIGGTLVAPVLIMLFYVVGIYIQTNSTCGEDTKFNSVFYGILKNSDAPEKDLKELGLSSDMAVEAGKHAYLPKYQYEKYVPWSDITIREFNQKISNFKLLKFYLMNPKRLLKGMEYTASQCFDTGGFLGKYEKSQVSEYTYSFKRFTLWSDFRNTILPKRLIFLIIFYSLLIIISVSEYLKGKDNKAIRLRLELFWLICIISLVQFPMPYIGNGEADTAKQLYLFNFTFDILFLTACTWVFDKLQFLKQTCNILQIRYKYLIFKKKY